MSESKCLLIDIGNSFIKFVFINQKWLTHRTHFLEQDLAAELNSQLNHFSKINHSDAHFLNQFNQALANQKISHLAICSVQTAQKKQQLITDLLFTRANQLKEKIHYFEAISQKKIVFLNQLELINSYQNPTQLGKDRWLAGIGSLFLNNLDNQVNELITVIDFGSVISIDFIEPNSNQFNQYHYLGGLLLPNFYLSSWALAQKMPIQLNDYSQKKLDFSKLKEFGQNTEDCIETGFLVSIQNLMKQHPLIKKSKNIYLTGGFLNSIETGLIDYLKVDSSNQWIQSDSLVLLGLLIQAQNHMGSIEV